MARLIITADDYGYAPSYDAGILEVARAGAVDAVSAMVLRPGCEPAPLLETGVEVGLHLELERRSGRSPTSPAGDPGAPISDLELPRAGEAERRHAMGELLRQLERFEALFGRPPTFLDGHHHAHARPGLGVVVARIARRYELVVRSVGPAQRRLLRCEGVATPDLLVGRLDQSEPALPPELAPDRPAIDGVVEWMVHPGHPGAASCSGYDRGRGEDLELLLGFEPPPGVIRGSHVSTL